MLSPGVQLSHNMKMALLVAAACVAAGGSAAYVVSKLHSSTAKAAAPPSSLRPGVIGRSSRFGFAPPGGFRHHGAFLGGRGGLSAAAGYLGLSIPDLLAKLQSGQTLADVAKATDGKSVAGLIDAMVSAEKAELNAAVRAGRLSQAEADQLSADLSARISAMVNRQPGFRPPFGDRSNRPGTPL